MVQGVNILLSPQEKRCTLLPGATDVHIQQHIHQKDLNLCLLFYFYAKVTIELGKTQTTNSTVLCLLCL